MTDTDELAAAVARAVVEPFGGVVRIEIEGEAPLFLDGRSSPPTIAATEPSPPATSACAWRASRETLLRALESERAFAGAYVSGRLLIAGDMSVMARLNLKGR